MAKRKRPWYERWRGTPATASGVLPGADASWDGDYFGNRRHKGFDADEQYLLANLRTNAPGFDNQPLLQMSQAYVGLAYLAVHSFLTMAGQSEVKLFDEDPDDPDSREELSHFEDAAQLIRNPNPDDDFGEILEQTALQNKLTGTAALWVPFDVDDEHDMPREMYVLPTASLLPQPIGPDYPYGAYLVQPWYPAGPFAALPQSRGVGAKVPAEQIIRIKEPHPFFRWTGYATLYAIGTQMDCARMIDQTRMNHMARGFDPAAIVSWDAGINRPDDAAIRRFEAQFKAVWQGPQNAGRMVVAPFGAKVDTFGNTPDKMAYQEGWLQLRDFGLAAMRVNPAVAGLTESSSYAQLYAALRWFYIFGLSPFLNKVAAKITKRILKPFFSPNFLLQLKGKSIADESLVEQQVNTLCRYGGIKKGELRQLYTKLGFPIALEKSKEDDEWIGAQQGQQPGGEQGGGNPMAALMGGGKEEQGEDDGEREMERRRPQNPEGRGTAGPRQGTLGQTMPGGGGERKSLTAADRHERLGRAIERHLTNGHIKVGKGQ